MTQTLTHTGMKAECETSNRAFKILKTRFWKNIFLLSRQHGTHGLCRLSLRCRGYMGIGIQRKPCGEMSQHTRYGFHIYAVLECQRGKGMAKVVETNLRQARSIQHPVEHICLLYTSDAADDM